jgi:hypothetical protein
LVRAGRLLGAVAFVWVGFALFANAAMATYGHIQIIKINQGGDPNDTFTFQPTFTWSGDPALANVTTPFALKGGESSPIFNVACNIERPTHVECGPHYTNVTLHVAEAPTAGYDLTDVTCRYTQSDDDVNGFSAGAPNTSSPVKPAGEVTVNLAAGTVDLKVHYNEWVACWFTNTKQPAPAPVVESAPPALVPIAAASSAPAPHIAVSPERVKPGVARLAGPTGCPTADVVVARVTGRSITRVVFYVDNRKVKTLRRANRGATWILSLRLKGLRYGTHRVKARVEFARSTGTAPKTLPMSFKRCGSTKVLPSFTG